MPANSTKAHGANEPLVGIFWIAVIDGAPRLLSASCPLSGAEPYGDCITHAAGHFERWEEWQASGSARLVSKGYPAAIASTEYDEWPRGRVIYETLTRRFVIYADRRLQSREVVDALTRGVAPGQHVVVPSEKLGQVSHGLIAVGAAPDGILQPGLLESPRRRTKIIGAVFDDQNGPRITGRHHGLRSK